nr:hypothetical protein CFP56_28366 [Quercus suber]
MGHRHRPSYTRSRLPEFEAQEQPDSSPSTRKNQLDPPRQIVETTPALPPLRAETNANTSNIFQGKQIEASMTPSQPPRKRKMVSGNDTDQVFEPPGDISHCASHLAMGHGHQPSIPISEAQLIGEAELQLDLPRTHASQMSTSRPFLGNGLRRAISISEAQETREAEHFHASQMSASRLSIPCLIDEFYFLNCPTPTMVDAVIYGVLMKFNSITAQEAEQRRSLVVGNDKEIEKLQGNLQTMKAELKEVEKSQFAQKFWFEKLKHISSEMNAVLDEWNTPTTKLKVQNEENVQKVCSSIASLLCCFY